jgi:hypothetical protein
LGYDLAINQRKEAHKMTTFSVLLACGTVGTVDADVFDGQHPSEFMGELVTVALSDCNGLRIEVVGEMVGVLEN